MSDQIVFHSKQEQQEQFIKKRDNWKYGKTRNTYWKIKTKGTKKEK